MNIGNESDCAVVHSQIGQWRLVIQRFLFEVLGKFEGVGKMKGFKVLQEEEASKVEETYGCVLEEKMESMSGQVVKLVMENTIFSPHI
tara:strand:- start:1797 stop:2060 length:264 start_codon:yes stop_codon:yes gene_type:complete